MHIGLNRRGATGKALTLPPVEGVEVAGFAVFVDMQ